MLPVDIIYKIQGYLSHSENLNFQQTNKYINSVVKSNNLYWKDAIERDYNKVPVKHFDYLKQYISTYKKLCILCKSRTKTLHKFTNERICRFCQETCHEKKLISRSRAKKEFLLNDSDLSSAEYVISRNYYNNRNNVKLYQLFDIEELSFKKHGSDENLESAKKIKTRKTTLKILFKLTQFMELARIMYNIYSIDIRLFYTYINKYSEGVFNKFLISRRIPEENLPELINCCLEIELISSTGYDIQDYTRSDFDTFLLDYLLTVRTDQIDFDHQAVVGKTEEILANNKEKFYRKNVIEILFSDRIDYKLYSEIIYRYITEGTGDPYEIFLDNLEAQYVMDNTDFDSLFFTYLDKTRSETKKLYKKFIIDRHSEGLSVPGELKTRYNLR
jgi:hypothetical protein